MEGETYRRYALGSYSEGTRERDRDRISTEDADEPEVEPEAAAVALDTAEPAGELTNEAAKSLKGRLFPVPLPVLPALPVFLLCRLVVKYSGS